MGGLALKKVISSISIAYLQTIIDAFNDSTYTELLKNFRAVVLMGTPHPGANLAPVLTKLLAVSFSQGNYVSQIELTSDLVQLILGQFRDRVDLAI